MKWIGTVTINPVLDDRQDWDKDLEEYTQKLAKDIDLVVLELTIQLLGVHCTPEQLRDALAEAWVRVQLGTKHNITEVEED